LAAHDSGAGEAEFEIVRPSAERGQFSVAGL